MKKISVEELKPGMVFNKAVYIDSDNMLVGPNVPLREEDIKKLMKWGITEVETAADVIKTDKYITAGSDRSNEIYGKYEHLLSLRKRLVEVHGNACYTMDRVYSLIRKDMPVDFDSIGKAVAEIVSLLKENSNIFIFLNILEETDKNYLVTHSVNVTFYSILIGLAMNYNDRQLMELGTGTILIDSGMTKIPVYIIHKQSNLTDSEYQMIKAHPLHGYKALINYPDINERIANVSLQHHEQFDGKGYPRGLKGKEIDEYARIAAIADSYEAQISTRSYKGKIGAYHAMKNLLASGVNKFDPDILKIFLSRMSVYPIGSLVQLNDKTIGIVIGSFPEKPLRPIIKLVKDSAGQKISDVRIINLLEDSTKFIQKVMDEKEAGISLFDILWG
ncbi:MAG TPA: HD domain-containing phosphohydrolase [Spirochaetota bacterium]|jgi:HD-GYP domain-containing protein (c-di-GMP phosphodiesterase class II)|nr:HD domain-containing protein [Spirochaetota bacterium]HOQ12347.1 HD domain-containing phosphohydrolase [Spirochaetota bacterium]HOV09272.1 HD domain-containing phosphohydrolase [Spirochaetota bacterium]HPX90053.1 HD domain-containing phosphohydrolase [Spirochaetota bacterium]